MNSFVQRHGVGMLLVLLLYSLPTATLLSEDWPRFRGPTGDGISSDVKVPLKWGDTNNLKWKLKLPGKGFSSPIVAGDYVFVTCYSDADRDADRDLNDLKRHLLCVHRHKGEVVWSKVVRSTSAENRGPSFGTRHGFASHTPVSDGERVYVLFGNSGVLAFDMKGKELWRQDVGKENASMFGSAASPILHQGQLIVTASAESE